MFNPACFECKLYQHLAKESSVPEGVWDVFERSIQEAEMGAKGWLEYLTSYRVIKLITYPAAMPIGVAKVLLPFPFGIEIIFFRTKVLRTSSLIFHQF